MHASLQQGRKSDFLWTCDVFTASSSHVQYFFVVERNGHYFILNFVFPLIITVTFSYLCFWLPFELFDRVALTVTIATAIFDICWVIIELRPKVAQESWMDLFQAKCIVLTALPAVETIVLSHVIYLIEKRQLLREAKELEIKSLLKQ